MQQGRLPPCAHCSKGFKRCHATNCFNCGVPTHPPGPDGCSLHAGLGYGFDAVVCAACLDQDPVSTVAQDALRWRTASQHASQAGLGFGRPHRESRSAAAVAADGVQSAQDTDVPGLETDRSTATDTTTAVEDALHGRHLRTCGHCHQLRALFSCYECGAPTHGPGPDGCSLRATAGLDWLAVVCARCLAQDPLSHKAAVALESDRNMRAAKEAGPGFSGPPRALRSATAAACVGGVPLDGVGGAPAAPPAPIPAPTPAARPALSHAFCGRCGEGRCTHHCCVCGEATHSPNRECSKWGWGGALSGVAVCAACCTTATAPKAKEAVSWERQLELRARSTRSGAAGMEEDGMEGVDDGDRSTEASEEEILTDAEARARRRRKTGAATHVACGMQAPTAASQGVGFFLCYHLDSQRSNSLYQIPSTPCRIPGVGWPQALQGDGEGVQGLRGARAVERERHACHGVPRCTGPPCGPRFHVSSAIPVTIRVSIPVTIPVTIRVSIPATIPVTIPGSIPAALPAATPPPLPALLMVWGQSKCLVAASCSVHPAPAPVHPLPP